MDEFRRIVLYMAPRILGFMDRTADSATYGCCDRYYWHYKMHDVGNARFQEASLFLAMLYSHDFEGNIYYQKPAVRQYALAAVSFWEKVIHIDGSVAEVYPFERSFCATGFSTFAALESLSLLSAVDRGEGFRKKVEKVGCWLMAHVNEDAANQMAAAALALHNIARHTHKDEFRLASEAIMARIIRGYQQDGCFVEYGGFDMGYTSITSSLLAWCGRQGFSYPGLEACVKDAQARIDKETGPDGQYPFADKSRKTQFLYPYGFFVTQSPVFAKILKGVAAHMIITPLWMDDRYSIALSTDYLMTLVAAKGLKEGGA